MIMTSSSLGNEKEDSACPSSEATPLLVRQEYSQELLGSEGEGVLLLSPRKRCADWWVCSGFVMIVVLVTGMNIIMEFHFVLLSFFGRRQTAAIVPPSHFDHRHPNQAIVSGKKCFQTKDELQDALFAMTETSKRESYNDSQIIEQIYGLPLTNWCVSNVTDMSWLFAFQHDFNLDLSGWDVSRVTNMSYMFTYAWTFNQPLDSWNVFRVSDMSYMFAEAKMFNQSLEAWNVSNVKDMRYMFYEAENFDQPLALWDVSQVESMEGLFYRAVAFNHPLEDWTVSSVHDMTLTFYWASTFNQSLATWDVSNVDTMTSMFFAAADFNQPLNNWNVSGVTSMRNMFLLAESFNQPLDSWNISAVLDTTRMFYNASAFNQNLCSWGTKLFNTLEVCQCREMFCNTNCSVPDDPDLLASPAGPFCVNCL